jgi:hypothetical protein
MSSSRPIATQTMTVGILPTPVVSSISPGSGPVSGGTLITIHGRGFTTGDGVPISQGHGAGKGAIVATQVTVVSSKEITAVTGGGSRPGVDDLFVVNALDKNSHGSFTYKRR